MPLKSDLERQGQTILNSHFLTVMLMTGTLPNSVMSASSLNVFKNQLFNYFCT